MLLFPCCVVVVEGFWNWNDLNGDAKCSLMQLVDGLSKKPLLQEPPTHKDHYVCFSFLPPSEWLDQSHIFL